MKIVHQKLVEIKMLECYELTLRRLIKEMCFQFTKLEKQNALIESKIIIKWHLKYLEEIQHFCEENRPIFHLRHMVCHPLYS